MKLTYLGHSVLLIEGSINAIIDPFITGNPQCTVSLDSIKKLDYIFVTHGHGDHFGDTIELAKKTGATVVCNYEIGLYLQMNGVENIHSMHIGGSKSFEFGSVKLINALHGSSIFDGKNIIYAGNPCGFLLEIDNKKIYHAGDTGLTLDMKLLEKYSIDVAFLPIGGNYVMDIEDAATAAFFIKPKLVVPIHYNTWSIINADANLFKSKVESLKINCKIMSPSTYMEV
ncbi:UPF0173 metal-dependent hydrolase [Tepiditoga spiralis]|uniref:UPF0173 metal-dependent hydrolase OSSY52_20900 n=1 Tax=Tepiditoga spiralis TaxID=2108365 RepID=A0A7G1GC91_9BACT|nr:metal-dependent hydrolase [Tepiditoga spiralis]BBE31949.1 UPF0173 metal-dependent hydrolase [Tepiditoga spiralis]